MRRIVDVNVGAWARICCFHFFVAWSIITAVESCMNGFLSDDFVLDVILLLLMVVLARSRNLCECLSGVRSLALMLPELASLSFCEEGLRFLSNELTIWIVLQVLLCSIADRDGCLVSSWSWIKRLDDLAFTIWYLRLEDFVFARGIELLLTLLLKVIDTWSRVIRPGLIVMPVVRLFEKSAIDLAHVELVLGSLWVDSVLLRCVRSRSDLIETSASVSSGSQFPCGNTRRDSVGDNGVVSVLCRLVFKKSFVYRLQIVPLRCLVVVPRVRVLQVRGSCNKARARGRWSKSCYLFK